MQLFLSLRMKRILINCLSSAETNNVMLILGVYIVKIGLLKSGTGYSLILIN